MARLETLTKGGGVLDVAGGQGKLAWELLNLHGVPVPRTPAVVDCRQHLYIYIHSPALLLRPCLSRAPCGLLVLRPGHVCAHFHSEALRTQNGRIRSANGLWHGCPCVSSSTRRAVQATVVDPRPLQLSRSADLWRHRQPIASRTDNPPRSPLALAGATAGQGQGEAEEPIGGD